MASIPYEKGFNFLFYLRTVVGGAEAFDRFFREFVDKHAYQTVDSFVWKAEFLAYFKDTKGVEGIDWDVRTPPPLVLNPTVDIALVLNPTVHVALVL
eukprot:1178647-Prorocentrum_minimum.AAC.2